MARIKKRISMTQITVAICDNFSVTPGTGVNWTNAAPGTTILSDGPWPFNVAPPIRLPSPANIGIKEGLKPGTYYFLPSCCKSRVSVTVT
jgi:hypothetical protein